MIKLVLAASLAIMSALAYAGTDFQCVSDCTNHGYMYQYCMSRCSYNDNLSLPQQVQPQNTYQVPHLPQTDFKCLSDCTQKGYLYQFCQQQCTY